MDVAVATILPPGNTPGPAPTGAPHSTTSHAPAIAIATGWRNKTAGIRWRQQQPPARFWRSRRRDQTTRVHKIKTSCRVRQLVDVIKDCQNGGPSIYVTLSSTSSFTTSAFSLAFFASPFSIASMLSLQLLRSFSSNSK